MKTYRHIAVGVVALFMVFVGSQMAFGQSNSSFWDNVAERLASKLFGQVSEQIAAPIVGDQEFGSSGTRMPNGVSADSTSPAAGEIRGTTLTVTATSTVQEVVLGSRFKKALTFTAASTSTPGGLVSIQNTGADKLCQRAEIKLTTKVEGAMAFSLATSTSATSYSGSGASIMATSTMATATAEVLSSSAGDHIGSSGMESFTWPNGTYILGAFDSSGAPDNASTTDYITAVGNLYLNCHSL